MKKLMIVYCFVNVVFAISCVRIESKTFDVKSFSEQLQSDTKIELPEFISFDENANVAIGDYSSSLIIKFDSVNFVALVNRIENVIQQERKIGNDSERTYWVKYESGYKFESTYPQKNYKKNYYVNTKNQILYYLYIED